MKKILPILLLLFIGGCFDVPDEFVAPEYQTDINLQVMKKTYTLKEIIEKDTANIKWFKDGNNKGILYYNDKLNIERFDIKDNLNVDAFSESVSQNIGNIKIYSVSPVNSQIGLSDWNSNISYGTFIFPEYYKDLSSTFNIIGQFRSATLSEEYSSNTNKVFIKISNNFPVDITLRGFEIVNNNDNSVILKKGDINSISEWVTVPKNSEKILDFNISSKIISNQVIFRSRLYTPGSNGTPVTFTSSSNINVQFLFSEIISIKSAEAKIPQQEPVQKHSAISIDDSTKLTRALINSGSFSFNFTNNLNTALILEFTSNSLKKSDGSFYSKTISIGSKSSIKISENNLTNWEVLPDSKGALEYSYTVYAQKNDNYVIINRDDNVSAKAEFSKIIFKSVEGQIKPTKFTIDEKPTRFNFKNNIQNKIGYANLIMQDAKIKLNLVSSAKTDIKIEGMLNIKYKQTGEIKRQNLNIFLPSSTPIDVDISGLLSGNNGKLPDEFYISGRAIVNPNYRSNVQISYADTVGGNTNIEIPMKASISGGSYTDTVKIDTDNIKEKDTDRLAYSDLLIELYNKIPLDATFSGKLIDNAGNVLLNIPPSAVVQNNQPQNYFSVNAAKVNSSGDVTEMGYTKQQIKITGDDASKVTKSKKMIINLNFNTSSNNQGIPIKLRYTDDITVKVKADSKINVKE